MSFERLIRSGGQLHVSHPQDERHSRFLKNFWKHNQVTIGA